MTRSTTCLSVCASLLLATWVLAAQPAPVQPASDKPTFEDQVLAANTAIEQGDWTKAADIWRLIRRDVRNGEHRKQVSDLEARLRGQAKAQLDVARQMLKDRMYIEAVDTYDKVAQTFGSMPEGLQADRFLDRAARDPVLRLPYQELQARQLYTRVNQMIPPSGAMQPTSASQPASQPSTMLLSPEQRAEAISRLPQGTQVEAIRLLMELAENYGKTPTGAMAVADLEVLDQAGVLRDVRAREDRREAVRLMNEADMYRRNGRPGRAAASYQQVVNHFPGTPEADEARRMLDDMNNRETTRYRATPTTRDRN